MYNIYNIYKIMYINFIKRATVREAQSCICNMIFMQFSSKSEKQAFTNNRILLIYNVNCSEPKIVSSRYNATNKYSLTILGF